MTKSILFGSLLVVCMAALPSPAKKLKPTRSFPLSMTEPSDICLSAGGNSLYVASGDRHIYEVDLTGKTLRKSGYEGFDYEAVYARDSIVYAVDESLRKIDLLDVKGLNNTKSYSVSYSGAVNKSFESLTWNAQKGCYVMVTEKDPCLLYELDQNFVVIDQVDIPQFSEISALTFYQGNIWFLSDEEETVYKVNPSDYSIIDQWAVPILNPEGIAFDAEGNLYISSDDMGRLFFFSKPQL